jgi:DNA segregation ATPase FtsK/SpoIIIE-like protein
MLTIILYIFFFPFIIMYYILKYSFILLKYLFLAIIALISIIINKILGKENTSITSTEKKEPTNSTSLVNKQKVSAMEIIDSLNGLQFESYVADLLKKLNYENVTVTPASGDFGIDILCEKNDVKYAIQCKNYNGMLDSKPIQEANSGKQYYNCHVGIVITNNYFTKHAQELAKSNGILLWDRDKLRKMVLQFNSEDISKANIDDKLNNEIIEFVINSKTVSTSLLQRKFKLGYNKAQRIIDMLEEKGMIGPADGSKPRVVLINK